MTTTAKYIYSRWHLSPTANLLPKIPKYTKMWQAQPVIGFFTLEVSFFWTQRRAGGKILVNAVWLVRVGVEQKPPLQFFSLQTSWHMTSMILLIWLLLWTITHINLSLSDPSHIGQDKTAPFNKKRHGCCTPYYSTACKQGSVQF